jgi:hypothetical protein
VFFVFDVSTYCIMCLSFSFIHIKYFCISTMTIKFSFIKLFMIFSFHYLVPFVFVPKRFFFSIFEFYLSQFWVFISNCKLWYQHWAMGVNTHNICLYWGYNLNSNMITNTNFWTSRFLSFGTWHHFDIIMENFNKFLLVFPLFSIGLLRIN